MLEGTAKSLWETTVKEVTDRKIKQRNDSRETVFRKTGQIKGSFKVAVTQWRNHQLKDGLLAAMQNYVRNGLRYPNNLGIKLRDWADRLRHINLLLTHFPRTKGTTAPKQIDSEELKFITMRAVPKGWMTELHASAQRLDKHTFSSLIDYLEALQTKEQLAQKSLKNR